MGICRSCPVKDSQYRAGQCTKEHIASEKWSSPQYHQWLRNLPCMLVIAGSEASCRHLWYDVAQSDDQWITQLHEVRSRLVICRGRCPLTAARAHGKNCVRRVASSWIPSEPAPRPNQSCAKRQRALVCPNRMDTCVACNTAATADIPAIENIAW